MSAARFVRLLAEARIGATFNFYRDGPRAGLRRDRLTDYLEGRRRAGILLVGEAPGYLGARVSGIPFTSERQLTGSGPAEATATIVRRVLAELGVEDEILLWNVVPTHPHRPGNPSSNRPRPRPRRRLGSSSSTSSRAKGGSWRSADWPSGRSPPRTCVTRRTEARTPSGSV
jgi:uracil DNA glycosylase superfamily protein